MATVYLKLVSVCDGGEHVKLQVKLDDVNKGTYYVSGSQVLNAFTEEQIPEGIATLISLRMIGRTKAEVRADLQAGLTITI